MHDVNEAETGFRFRGIALADAREVERARLQWLLTGNLFVMNGRALDSARVEVSEDGSMVRT